MNATITENVYKSRDNVIEWLFTESKLNIETGQWEESPIDFVTKVQVTKMVLHIDGNSIESGTGEISFFDEGRVELKLGMVEALKINRHVQVSLDVYSAKMPNGKTMVHPGQQQCSANVKIRDPLR